MKQDIQTFSQWYIGFEGNSGVKRKGTRDWRYNILIFSIINVMPFYKVLYISKSVNIYRTLLHVPVPVADPGGV